MSSFVDFLQPYNPAHPRMPLLHSTSFQSFREIIQSHILRPTPCAVFEGEELLYLFYGRPAYRVSSTVTSQGQLRHLPVCFILKPQSLRSAKRIYPFDSGAFSGGLFSQFLKGFDLKKFELGSFPDGPQRLVSAFYGSNKNYYYGDVSGSINATALQFEINGYVDMLRDTTVTYATPGVSAPSDDRRQTIEIQSEASIGLQAEQVTDPSGTVVVNTKVLAVILPQPALDSADVIAAVTGTWQAEPITYKLYKFGKPAEYHSVVREKVADLLERNKVL